MHISQKCMEKFNNSWEQQIMEFIKKFIDVAILK